MLHNSIISVAELDLDYLERRGGNTITYEGAEGSSKEEDSPADTLDRVKVIFLGAPGVGKTSIIRVRFNSYAFSVYSAYLFKDFSTAYNYFFY